MTNGGRKSTCIVAKGKIGVTLYPKRAECNSNFGWVNHTLHIKWLNIDATNHII